MIRTEIPKLNKEQTKQLVSDLKNKTSTKDLLFWKNALEQSKKIKTKKN